MRSGPPLARFGLAAALLLTVAAGAAAGATDSTAVPIRRPRVAAPT